jgi:thioredoxin 1
MTITTLNESNFRDEIKEGVVLVSIWAQWARHSVNLNLSLEELEEEFIGKAQIKKVNYDECGKIVEVYAIKNLPTLLFFKNGEEVRRLEGGIPKEELKRLIRKYI